MVIPMTRTILISLILVITAIITARCLLDDADPLVVENTVLPADFPRGPHNGRLLEQDGFAVEITIFETGVPPEFRVYAYSQGSALDPSGVDLSMQLVRTGNVTDDFDFAPHADFLRGNGVVAEPHSFDVVVMAEYQGNSYRWSYASYEGRTRIPDSFAREAGIETEIAGPVTIVESLPLSGRVEINPGNISEVRARFPGVVKTVRSNLGATVKAGDALMTVQSNESLQDYTVQAPISGVIIKRNVQPGEVTADKSLFTIADLSTLWVQLDIFTRDMGKLKPGQPVVIETLDGFQAAGVIDWLEPLTSHASQSIHARVPINNTDNRLRPGQFVNAQVGIAEHNVPLAVKRSGVQGFRDFQVVFAKFGETYEVRMLEIGISNDEWLEVTGGLTAGTEYVTGNSYLIKADIEKSGASHDH